MVNTTMSETVRNGDFSCDNNYNWKNYGPGNRNVCKSMTCIEDMIQKMINIFDMIDDNVKNMHNDLSGIG